MGKPLSRPGCFRKSSCCLEKHGAGDRGLGGRDGGVEGGYGDGYVPQRSIYDTMCINQQIDSHHHHHGGGSIRRDFGGEGSFSYSASGSLRVSRPPPDMFDPPRSLTPNPSFVRRLDERAIYDSLKLGGQDVDGGSCHSPGHFNRSVSPSVSSFSAPGVSSSSSKKHHHHHHHHHGDSTKSRDSRHSWKVLTPPKHLECLELTTSEMMDRGGGYLNPGHYTTPGGQSSSLTSPLISPFSGSPLSSGYHTPVFFSPAKPRPSQTQSLRCSPPQVIQPRHYSQTQSLRLSPPQELKRSPYRSPLVQLSAHDLEQDLRERAGGWGRSEREREWEREREREMERGWAQREWERERERGRLERERARERERRETSFGTFGYGRPVPLRSERDSVFLDPDQGLDTTPLLLPQPSPSPSPNAAPRMGTGAVGRNRAGSKVGPEGVGGGMVPKYDNGGVGLVLVDSKSGCGPRLVCEVGVGNMSEAEYRAGMQEHHRNESWNKYDNGSRSSFKNMPETRMGSQVKTRPGGRDLEGKVQSGLDIQHVPQAVNKEGHRGGSRSGDKLGRSATKPEYFAEPVPPSVNDFQNRARPVENVELEDRSGPKMETDIDDSLMYMDRKIETKAEVFAKDNDDIVPAAERIVQTKLEADVKVAPTSKPEATIKAEVDRERDRTSYSEPVVVSDAKRSIETMNTAHITVVAEDKIEVILVDQAEKKPSETDKIQPGHGEKSSRSHKSKSSKSSSRTRPGTATGLRPGVLSPRQNRGFRDLEPTSPAEGIESTWPRRIIVRKRTVRQGGALHNLPILPPLPSVLSALEKRRPLGHLHPRPGHFSENPLSSLVNVTSIVGRCSLKEPSHAETVQGLVGRASLKEQNLEHWRVSREQEEPRRSRSKEKQGEQSKEKTEREEKRGKEEKREKEKIEDEVKVKDEVGKEKVVVSVELVEETPREKVQRRVEVRVQDNANKNKEVKKERAVEITYANVEDVDITIGEQHEQDMEEVVTKLQKDEGEADGGEVGEEGGVESWDSVLDMVNTLWDDGGWEKGGTAGAGEGDADSFSGSLQRWPLLRPPVGFGGSHPPSSAASELSLTELERRARELDSDLEHLDLSQPHRDTQDVYPALLEPQRERADMYQTHPGPQRDKAPLLSGVGSRSQVTLELSTMASPATDADKSPAGWSTRSTGTSTVGTSSTKEDSSPDSNLTLESDSSGVFLSLSNQSQEEAGSDSDQPISGSDLGSSSTSLEKDGDDTGLKEWGREESSELQWCYPSLLNTSTQEDVEGFQKEDEALEKMGGYKEKGRDDDGRKDVKIGKVSIIKTQRGHSISKGSMMSISQQSEDLPPRKKVTLMGLESPLPLSPSKQPIKHFLDPSQKPIRTSGLDCGDLDPFVQSDSFVYLAVSARPGSKGEPAMATNVSPYDIKKVTIQQHTESTKTYVDPPNTEQATKAAFLGPQRPEEGDFLCTDSFVYLAAPACLLLGPAGSTSYSGKESDSESSGSGPVDVSVLGCGSVAGDSDWDSDQSDSDPSRSSRISAPGTKSAGVARPKRPPTEPDWDLFGDATEPEVLSELFTEQDRTNNSSSGRVPGAPGGTAAAPSQPGTSPAKTAALVEQLSTTKKVTWQFKPAQRSVCTGSRKEKDRELMSSASVRLSELESDEFYRPSPSSSSSSSPSSSSSG